MLDKLQSGGWLPDGLGPRRNLGLAVICQQISHSVEILCIFDSFTKKSITYISSLVCFGDLCIFGILLQYLLSGGPNSFQTDTNNVNWKHEE